MPKPFKCHIKNVENLFQIILKKYKIEIVTRHLPPMLFAHNQCQFCQGFFQHIWRSLNFEKRIT